LSIVITLFLLGIISGTVAQYLFRRLEVSTALPLLGYIAWSTYQEFFVPYKGGGASFWPLDIIFAGPAAAMGGAIGAFIAIKLFNAKNKISLSD